MRALICDRYEGIDSLRVGEMPEPSPGPSSALVEVRAAGVNFADTLIVSGGYQLRPELPFVPGTELSGVVLEAGQSAGTRPGDRVCGFLPYGAMAERAVVEGGALIPLPEGVDLDTAATIPVAYGTSYHALVDRARLAPGETLLVLGAAGGVGLAAVQVGKALGARVLAAVSSDEKEKAAFDAGADEVIRYEATPLREAIDRVTDGAGVDVVYDPVGGDSTELALRSTRWNGRLLVVGFASGRIPHIPLNLPLVKGTALVGVFWGRFTEEEPGRNTTNNRVIMDWVAEGRLRPRLQKAYPLDRAQEALTWVAERRAIGRVVVVP